MICGVGTDIVEVSRIRAALDKWGDKFTSRIFNNIEINYCYSKSDPPIHLAARFAAKEACIKAVSAVRTGNLSMQDIVVSNDESGRPSITISQKGALPAGIRILLSISHERNYAVAYVIAEQQ
jgi:holo-[acyl-carrier protein] synthase